jgi:hypothetical protein
MIAPKQKGEKHPSAGEERKRNKEANNVKDVYTRVKEPGPYVLRSKHGIYININVYSL